MTEVVLGIAVNGSRATELTVLFELLHLKEIQSRGLIMRRFEFCLLPVNNVNAMRRGTA